MDRADAGGDAGGDGVVACSAFATTLCARRWECLPLAFSNGHGFGDAFGTEARCVDRMTLACRGWGSLPETGATPDAIAGCTAEIAARDCRTSTQTLTRPAAGCALERGTLGTGSACESHLQCASGNCPASGPDSATWKCAASGAEAGPEPAPLGAPCASPTACGANLVCLEGVCRAPALLGEPCGAAVPACAPYAELRCDESGVCAPHPTSQDACGGHTASFPFAACESGECVGRNDFGLGHCEPDAEDGAACDLYAGPACLYPARCMSHVCRVPGL